MVCSLNSRGMYIGDCIVDCCRVIKGDTSVQTIACNSSY